MSQRSHSVELVVRSAKAEDVYKDIIRISERDRGDLKAGRVHLFRSEHTTARFILRGLSSNDDGNIRMDEVGRQRLGVAYGQPHKFEISECGFFGELLWSFNATDPAYRVAARLGVLSFVMALVGLLAVPIALRDVIKWLAEIRWAIIGW